MDDDAPFTEAHLMEALVESCRDTPDALGRVEALGIVSTFWQIICDHLREPMCVVELEGVGTLVHEKRSETRSARIQCLPPDDPADSDADPDSADSVDLAEPLARKIP